MKERHVIVVSVDAMVYEDVEALSGMSAFRDRWPQMARVNRIRSVYPTITSVSYTHLANLLQFGTYSCTIGVYTHD